MTLESRDRIPTETSDGIDSLRGGGHIAVEMERDGILEHQGREP